jgi:hypothetical protein
MRPFDYPGSPKFGRGLTSPGFLSASALRSENSVLFNADVDANLNMAGADFFVPFERLKAWTLSLTTRDTRPEHSHRVSDVVWAVLNALSSRTLRTVQGGSKIYRQMEFTLDSR